MSTAVFPLGVKDFGAGRVNGEYLQADDVNELRAEVAALEGAALGGWLSMPESCAYAGLHSFSAAGDRTAAYTPGRRVRWYQSSTPRYGVIASAVYAAPRTTVTILTSFEYAFSNSPISAMALSDLEAPQGWPGWFTWIPTYSAGGGMSFSSVTTQYARYRASGRGLYFMLRASGTTGGAGFNELRASLPVTAAALTGQFLPFHAGVEDGAPMLGRGWVDTSAQALVFGRYDGAVFGIGAGRVIAGQGWYEW